jgi:hypothetical protein
MIRYFIISFLIFNYNFAQELTFKEIDLLTGNPIYLLNESKIGSLETQSFDNLTYDCGSVFWTISKYGNIRQWNLIANQITGGSPIQNFNGKSLAFCSDGSSLTFFSSNYPSTGILKYDTNLGWVTISTSIPLLNNGGFLENQYFFKDDGFSLKELYYFDGTNITLVEHLIGTEVYAVADIAVDSYGRAWVFTRTTNESITSSIKVYNQSGLLFSLPISFDSGHCYGSFFINDNLYLGFGGNAFSFRNSILPIIYNGINATLGIPIPFYDSFFADMASCNNQTTFLNTNSNIFINKHLMVYPNPSKNYITIQHKQNLTENYDYSIIDLIGRIVKSGKSKFNELINIENLTSGNYIIQIETEKGEKFTEKLIKN